MLLEAVNSAFLTFLATEYLLSDHEVPVAFAATRSPPLRLASAGVLFLNAFLHFHATGAALAHWIHVRADAFCRAPRILVAMASFLLALYWDCRQKHERNAKSHPCAAPWSDRYFLRQLATSLCRLLPVYPFLAVVISFGFLFVVSAFENLHLDLQMLNMPIYYGTLYG